jgi:hypothetical protein
LDAGNKPIILLDVLFEPFDFIARRLDVIACPDKKIAS